MSGQDELQIQQILKEIINQPRNECLDELTVYQSKWPKSRLGNLGDGGYVIADLPGEIQ